MGRLHSKQRRIQLLCSKERKNGHNAIHDLFSHIKPTLNRTTESANRLKFSFRHFCSDVLTDLKRRGYDLLKPSHHSLPHGRCA